jgi:peptide chain release factor 1
MRRSQVGSGARSEKIRTYNYKDNRVTDHRLNQNFTLTPVLEGDIDDLIQSCISRDQQERLEELAAESSPV